MSVNSLTTRSLEDLKFRLAEQGDNAPIISVIVPVYHPDLKLFSEAVASVKAQVYLRWQMCLCDDGSGDPAVQHAFEAMAEADPRIVYRVLPKNAGISQATNAAAELATGDVLLFLDQDDVLAPDCLAEFALAFAADPSAGMAYSDNDKLDEQGLRCAPSFKPAWSPVLLLSHMYMVHAVALRRDVFERIGGCRSAFDGSQDFDLALRAGEVTATVLHIPKILYHWRAGPGSTALNAGEKPNSTDAGRRAVEDAVRRRAIAAKVDRPQWAARLGIGLFALEFHKPDCFVSLIVTPSPWQAVTCEWLSCILAGLPREAQLVLVSEPDDDLVRLAAASRMRFARIDPQGALSDDLAYAARHTEGEVVLCAQAGAIPTTRMWLSQLCGYTHISGVGLVGPRLMRESERLHSVGGVVPGSSNRLEPALMGLDARRPGPMYLSRAPRECVAVPAVVLAMNSSSIGALTSLPAGLDDAWQIGWLVSQHVQHAGGTVVTAADVDVLWPGFDATNAVVPVPSGDKYYNVNLADGDAQFKPRRRCPELRSLKPIRIVAVSHNLDREGAQTTLLNLLVRLRRSNFAEIEVVSGRDGELRSAFEQAGCAVTVLDLPRRRAGRSAFASYEAELRSRLRSFGPDVVLANTLETFCAVNAAQAEGLPALWWQHEGGSWQRYFKGRRFCAQARAFAAFAQAYRVVQVAESTRRGWKPVGLRENFQVIRHGVPPEHMDADLSRWSRSAARSLLGVEDDEVCIVAVGSVSARKGQADLAEAINRMQAAEPVPVKVFVVGALVDPSYAEQLTAILDTMPAIVRKQIEITGAVPDISCYYRAADIAVCCSRQESAPRALLEAMSFALPIVTTPVDGIPEMVVNNQNGLYFTPGDVAQLEYCLRQLCASPALRDRLGQRGCARVSEVGDYESMVRTWKKLLLEAVRTRLSVPGESGQGDVIDSRLYRGTDRSGCIGL